MAHPDPTPPAAGPAGEPTSEPICGVDPARPGLRVELLLVLAALGAVTALAWTTRLDVATADLFRTPCCSWPMNEHPVWGFVFRWAVLPGVLLAAAAMVLYTASFWRPRALLSWRRPALFLVLVAALGPGLVVNVIFKDHYGRPRPREVVELGGAQPYLPVLVPGSDRQAKSFPCGHCAMGFYLGIPWLVLRRRHRRAAWAFLAAGFTVGGLLRAARVMAGGHFVSDAAWAGGMVWLVALGLHRLLDLDRPPPPPPDEAGLARDRRRARLVTLLAGGLLAGLTVAVLVATPYLSKKAFARSPAQLAALGAAPLTLELDQATVAVAAGPALDAAYEVQAFGFPTSRLNFTWREGAEGGRLAIEQHGWFTERRTTVTAALPGDGARPLTVRLGRGTLTLDLSGFAPGARLDVEVGEGEARVKGAERPGVSVRVLKGRVVRE